MPKESSTPYIGEPNQLEKVEEVRIESIIYESIESKVITALKKAHPYEEVAYDTFIEAQPGKKLGLGRIGELNEAMTLDQFTHHVKEKLEVSALRFVGNPANRVKKVAVLGGTGNKYMTAAKYSGADVFVTGDIDYHIAHDALLMGLNLVDPGHNVEKVMKQGTVNEMAKRVEKKGFDVEFLVSAIHTDPFSFN